MHAEPVGTTTASMIARLAPSSDEPLTYWASLGSPCLSAFIPLYVDADVPAALTRGGEHAADDSLWWQAQRIRTLVEANWSERGPLVRNDLDQFEARVAERMEREKITIEVTRRAHGFRARHGGGVGGAFAPTRADAQLSLEEDSPRRRGDTEEAAFPRR